MRYRNIIDFYMLVNNLKDIYFYDDETVANHMYEALMLAVAINSEYEVVDDLGLVIKDIVLKSLIKHNLDKVNKHFSSLEFDGYDSNKYKKVKEYMDLMKNVESVYSPYMNEDVLLSCESLRIENILSHSDNRYSLRFKVIEKAYSNFGPDYEFKESGLDHNKNENIMKFVSLNKKLKESVRTGWDDNHWNIIGKRETIAEHVIGTIGLAIALDMYNDLNIDINKVVTMLAIHEVGEILIGDITPFDNVTKEEKMKIEHTAMEKVLECLNNKEELFNLLSEFDKQETNEAKFAHMCDKIEADIQSKVYYEKGVHHTLNDQSNNVVFKSQKVKNMVNDGAKTPFDIWFQWDLPIYEESEVFTKTLVYVDQHNIRN